MTEGGRGSKSSKLKWSHFWPSPKEYKLSNAELKMLKETYATILDINSITIKVYYKKLILLKLIIKNNYFKFYL